MVDGLKDDGVRSGSEASRLSDSREPVGGEGEEEQVGMKGSFTRIDPALSVEEKRNNLLQSSRNYQVGRRPAPDPVSFKERNRAMLRGLLLGFVVVVIILAVVIVVGSMTKM